MKHAAETAESKAGSKEGEQEEVKFPVPDFKPEQFMGREIESAKLAVLNTAYGVLLAGIAAVVQALFVTGAQAGWITLLVGVAALRLVYRLGKVTVHEWKPKEWLGAYFTLFFSFLAFWYVFTNPPFA